jgi:hypothetical protein
MSEACLNQIDLARRWKISPRTLERWRWLREGPRYLKLGGRVLYRVADIEAYERSIVCLTKADGSGAWHDAAGSSTSHCAGSADTNGSFPLHSRSNPDRSRRAVRDGEAPLISWVIG